MNAPQCKGGMGRPEHLPVFMQFQHENEKHEPVHQCPVCSAEAVAGTLQYPGVVSESHHQDIHKLYEHYEKQYKRASKHGDELFQWIMDNFDHPHFQPFCREMRWAMKLPGFEGIEAIVQAVEHERRLAG